MKTLFTHVSPTVTSSFCQVVQHDDATVSFTTRYAGQTATIEMRGVDALELARALNEAFEIKPEPAKKK